MKPIDAAAVLHTLERNPSPGWAPPAEQVLEALQTAGAALLAQQVVDNVTDRQGRLRHPVPNQPTTEPVRRAWALMTERYTDLGVALVCTFPPAVVTTMFMIALQANGHPVD